MQDRLIAVVMPHDQLLLLLILVSSPDPNFIKDFHIGGFLEKCLFLKKKLGSLVKKARSSCKASELIISTSFPSFSNVPSVHNHAELWSTEPLPALSRLVV